MINKAIILDVDGTIANSSGIWKDYILPQMFNELDIIPHEGHILEIIKMSTSQEISKFININYPTSITPLYVLDAISRIGSQVYKEKVTLKQGVKEFISYSKEKGIKVAIITGCATKVLIPFLNKNELINQFDLIMASEDISKYNTNKSQSDIYYIVAKKLNVKAEDCLLFDDSLGSIKAAKSVGMNVVGVDNYQDNKIQEEILISCGKDNFIINFSEAFDCVKRLLDIDLRVKTNNNISESNQCCII